ncbi:MAG: hypothetical protein LRZ98_01260 [Candidatus Pacebacteria bacterium]|nr:hypothetical protein [Candidatus Paceibacterota bacterium]
MTEKISKNRAIIALLINIFIPGLGSLIGNKTFQGVIQLSLFLMASFLNFTVILLFIGIPLYAIA